MKYRGVRGLSYEKQEAFEYPHIHIIYDISISILYRKTSQLLIKILNTKFQSN